MSKSSKERNSEGPGDFNHSAGDWEDLIRARDVGDENSSPGHSCSSKVGGRLSGDDDDATKKEKHDTEKTRTPGGRRGKHSGPLFS